MNAVFHIHGEMEVEGGEVEEEGEKKGKPGSLPTESPKTRWNLLEKDIFPDRGKGTRRKMK